MINHAKIIQLRTHNQNSKSEPDFVEIRVSDKDVLPLTRETTEELFGDLTEILEGVLCGKCKWTGLRYYVVSEGRGGGFIHCPKCHSTDLYDFMYKPEKKHEPTDG